MSIASEMTQLATNKVAIKQAILLKSPVTQPGDDMSDWAASIASIPSEVRTEGNLDDNDVIFCDYDGTVLHTYSRSEVSSMESLPQLPTRTGMEYQGWNWTLNGLKQQALQVGKALVSAICKPADDCTKVTITIPDAKYSEVPMRFSQTVSHGVEVNWGDGSIVETFGTINATTRTHQYSPAQFPATYTITFKVNSGSLSFPTNIMGKSGSTEFVWLGMIRKIHFGANVVTLGDGVLRDCHLLTKVSIPESVTTIGTYAFRGCASLRYIGLPTGVTNIQSYTFYYCTSLSLVSIPEGLTTLNQEVFNQCSALTHVVLPSGFPGGIQSSTFNTCKALHAVYLPNSFSTTPTISAQAFNADNALTYIKLPSNLTTLTTKVFYGCEALSYIKIPSSVTSIEANAFAGCRGLLTFDFRDHSSVPTLADPNVFYQTPNNREIVVPDSLYNTWIETGNWSSSTNGIVESIVKASESSIAE